MQAPPLLSQGSEQRSQSSVVVQPLNSNHRATPNVVTQKGSVGSVPSEQPTEAEPVIRTQIATVRSIPRERLIGVTTIHILVFEVIRANKYLLFQQKYCLA